MAAERLSTTGRGEGNHETVRGDSRQLGGRSMDESWWQWSSLAVKLQLSMAIASAEPRG